MLQDLHWLRSPECIDFMWAVLIYQCLHGLMPRYLSNYIQRVADSNCCHLRSSSFLQRVIRRKRLSTVGDRAFPVAGRLEAASGTVCRRHHLSSNADGFSEPPQNSYLFPIILLPNCFWFLILYTVYSSGLAVLYLSHCK